MVSDYKDTNRDVHRFGMSLDLNVAECLLDRHCMNRAKLQVM